MYSEESLQKRLNNVNKRALCLYLQGEEEKAQQDQEAKGIEMEGDFDGQMEDLPPNDDSDQEDEGDEDRLQQEMGDVGEAGETVDERLWGDEDKPEEAQQGPEKKEKDSTVQVCLARLTITTHFLQSAKPALQPISAVACI